MKVLLKFIAFFCLIYALLVALGYFNKKTIAHKISNHINSRYSTYHTKGLVKAFDQHQLLKSTDKVLIMFSNTDLYNLATQEAKAKGLKNADIRSTYSDLNFWTFFWIPFSILFALILASPVNFKRKSTAFIVAFFLLTLFTLLKWHFFIDNNFNATYWLQFEQHGKAYTYFSAWFVKMIAQIGTTITVVIGIWVLTTFRKNDFVQAKQYILRNKP